MKQINGNSGWFGKIVAALIFAAPVLATSINTICTTDSNSQIASKNRKIVLTSDGKLVVFYTKGSSGGYLYYRVSSDAGATWGDEILIGGDGYYASQSSVWKDSSDNIYVIYLSPSTVNMRKIIYDGNNFSLSSTIVTVAPRGGYYPYPSIAKEPSGRLWASFGYTYPYTTLSGAHDASTTTITVNSTNNFANSGKIKIDSEIIQYTSKTATQFQGCTRGVDGTTAASHSNGALIYYNTLLNGTIDSSATTITVVSTSNFAMYEGRIKIDNEIIKYRGKTATEFLNCVRGVSGTTPASHNDQVIILPPSTWAVATKYSDDDGLNWSELYSPYDCYYGRAALVIYNNYPALFGDSGSIPWSYWNGTTWVSQGTIPGASDVYEDYSICVTNNNYIHVAFSSFGNNVKHTYYNGTSWLSTPNTLQGTASKNPALTTDGVNLWCFWRDSGTGNIVYKKYNGTNWDANPTNLTTDGLNNRGTGTIYKIGENNAIIPIIWFSGSNSPYNIQFSKIVFSPKVTGISPGTGENSNTTTMTITGQGFFGETFSSDVTSVKLDDSVNTTLDISSASISDLTISNVIVPAGVKVGTYNVKVTTNKGTNTTSTQKFIVTTNVVPTVTNIVPNIAGQTGVTEITIYGTGFFGGTTYGPNPIPDVRDIRLSDGANTQITIGTVVSDTQINNCIVPSGIALGTYDVKVYTGGGNNTTSSVKLRIVVNPTVTGLSVLTAPNNVATTLDITGTGFWGGGSSSDVEWIKIVRTDGLYQKDVIVPPASSITDTTITGAIIPASAHAGTYDVRVRTYSGGNNSTSTDKFVITTPVTPSVSNLSLSSGNNYFEISTLNIYGSGFFGGTNEDDVRDIRLNDVANTQITKGVVLSDTSIINCIVPSGIEVGTYDVKVYTGGGNNNTSEVKYKVTAMPIVSTISTNTGSNLVQHTNLTLTGNYFTGVTQIAISGVREYQLFTFHFVDDTKIDMMMIPDKILAGTYDIKVTTPNGTNLTSACKWIATTDIPHLNNVFPSTGSNANSTTITLTGLGFFGGTSTIPDVRAITLLKSTDLANYTVISDTLAIGVIPNGLLVGEYEVKVTTGGGNSTEIVKFNVTTPIPVVSEIVPNKGIREQDVTVNIFGSGFFGGTPSSQVTNIKINNINLSGYDVYSDNGIFHVVIPAGLDTGRYSIIVTTTGGSSSIDGPKYDILFKADKDYNFSKLGVSLNIPQNTFGLDTAIIVEDKLSDLELEKVNKANKIKYSNMKMNKILDDTVRKIESTEAGISNGKSLRLSMNYSGIEDSVIEKNFRIARLNNEGRWEYVGENQNVDTVNKKVESDVFNLSIFRLVQYVEAASNLNNLVIYPNPIDFSTGTGTIKFVNLTANPTLKVYTISGELVKEIKPDDIGNPGNDGRIEWDGRNDNGELIKRGLYIYLITDETGGRKVGKFVVK